MKIKHIGFFLKDSIFDAERVMDDLVGYCEMEHTKLGTIYHLQIVVDGEIVRCKDCKYLHQLSDGQIFCENKDGLPLMIGDLTADDFCSRGERKDE